MKMASLGSCRSGSTPKLRTRQDAVEAAIAELKQGLARNKISTFHEAVLLGVDGRSDFNGLHSRYKRDGARRRSMRARVPPHTLAVPLSTYRNGPLRFSM